MNIDLTKPLPQMEPQAEGVTEENTENDVAAVGELHLVKNVNLKIRGGCCETLGYELLDMSQDRSKVFLILTFPGRCKSFCCFFLFFVVIQEKVIVLRLDNL